MMNSVDLKREVARVFALFAKLKFAGLGALLLGFITIQDLSAQSVNNPGYLGKTSTVGMGAQLSTGLYSGLKTQALFAVNVEQVVNRQHSVQLRGTVGLLNVPFEKVGLSVDGPGSGATANYYGTLDCGNAPALHTSSFGLLIKRYVLNRGAIAPYGMYVTGGGEWRTVSASDSFNQLVFVEDNSYDPNAAYRFKLPNVMPRNTKGFNVLVGIGNKRFLNEQFFIDYQFGMTWLFWSNVDAYNNYYDAQAVGAAYNVQNSIELQMRRADTRRQLFTLNITTGMVF